jgi:hypothetical protein
MQFFSHSMSFKIFILSFSIISLIFLTKLPQLHIFCNEIFFSPNFSVITLFIALANLLLSYSEFVFLFFISFFLLLFFIVVSSGNKPKVLNFLIVLILSSTWSNTSLLANNKFFCFISSNTWFSKCILKSTTSLFKFIKSILAQY